jgi:hypothetical protein
MIKKYTANYAYTNPNFTIQNQEDGSIDHDLNEVLWVLKKYCNVDFQQHYLNFSTRNKSNRRRR